MVGTNGLTYEEEHWLNVFVEDNFFFISKFRIILLRLIELTKI